MTPDPEAVRKALEAYDETYRLFRGDKLTAMQFQYRRANHSLILSQAARAWLAQQDEEAKRKAREAQAYLRKMSGSVGYGPDFT